MGIQPSASRTGLLLDCPRPFAEDTVIEYDPPREAARYGTAFHYVLALCIRGWANKKPIAPGLYAREIDKAAKAWNIKPATEELAGHVRSSLKVLTNWITREKLKVVEIESAYAVNPSTGKARPIASHDEEHHYNIKSGEMPLTLDLSLRDDRRIFFFDHKTGWQDWEGGEFALPATVAQMRTVGLVAQRTPKLAPHLGIFHADRHGLPDIYVDEYEPEVVADHTTKLKTALTLIGSGFLRPGKQCARCPAQDDCPARHADIIADGTAEIIRAANTLADEPIDPRRSLVSVGSGNMEMRAAALYDLLKRFRVLEKAGTEEIRRLVYEGHTVETRDGVLTLHTQSFETLSKKSVIEALGKLAGERMLSRLRKRGAVRTTTREVLVPEK